ncbi:Uncharacterised protein r2_g1760 [Pycnogonum litorale]
MRELKWCPIEPVSHKRKAVEVTDCFEEPSICEVCYRSENARYDIPIEKVSYAEDSDNVMVRQTIEAKPLLKEDYKLNYPRCITEKILLANCCMLATSKMF